MNTDVTWKLERNAYTKMGTFGILKIPGHDDIYTVEQVWLNNTPNMSCIPIGDYFLTKYFSPSRTMDVVLLSNDHLLGLGNANLVPRKYIEIHPANWAKELRGCIGPGLDINSSWGVSDSRKAMDVIMTTLENSLINGESVKLRITNDTSGGIPK